jgi:hypothetical protein
MIFPGNFLNITIHVTIINVQCFNDLACLEVSELSLNCVGSYAADGFVVQTGDPEGPAEGFIDPSTGKVRTVPLEIMVDGDKAPVYGETLEVSRRSLFS